MLPNELWYNVFSYLSPRDVAKISCVRNLYGLKKEEILYLTLDENDSWRWAVLDGCTKVLEIWIRNGINIDKKNKYENTALILASCNGYTNCVKLLLQNGAKVNHQNVYGHTALHWVCRYDYRDIHKLLIDAGADPFLRNISGETPCDWVIRYLEYS